MERYEDNIKDFKKEIHLGKDTMVMDRYQIIDLIDRGGFCYTYRAMDTRLNIEVALKEFFPHGVASRMDGDTVTVFTESDQLNFEKGKNRFLREARGLAQFNQISGIVSVYDYFEYNSTAYIVMEYLKGKNLKRYMADIKGNLTSDFIYDTARKMCDVLKVIHARNVIHRDISPDNIFLCEDGTLKLIDFGALNQDYNGNNSTVTVILKQGYAPFEQYYDDGLQGPWTDIYALGATLYNLCTGRVPQQSVARFNQNNLIPPHELNPNISKNFSMAIMKAMSLRIEDRYQNAEEFEQALFDKTEHPDEYYSAADNVKTEAEKEEHTFAAMDELEDSGETFALFSRKSNKDESDNIDNSNYHEPVNEKINNQTLGEKNPNMYSSYDNHSDIHNVRPETKSSIDYIKSQETTVKRERTVVTPNGKVEKIEVDVPVRTSVNQEIVTHKKYDNYNKYEETDNNNTYIVNTNISDSFWTIKKVVIICCSLIVILAIIAAILDNYSNGSSGDRIELFHIIELLASIAIIVVFKKIMK